MSNKIVLNSATKLSDLLSAYPWMKEALAEISDQFKLLNSPFGKVMASRATILEMSKRSGIDEAVLIEKLQSFISAHKE